MSCSALLCQFAYLCTTCPPPTAHLPTCPRAHKGFPLTEQCYIATFVQYQPDLRSTPTWPIRGNSSMARTSHPCIRKQDWKQRRSDNYIRRCTQAEAFMWLSGPMSCRGRVETVSGAPQQPLTAPPCAPLLPNPQNSHSQQMGPATKGHWRPHFSLEIVGIVDGNCGNCLTSSLAKESFDDSFAPIGPSTRYRQRWPVKHLRPLTLLPSFPHLLDYRPSHHVVVNRRIGWEGVVVVVVSAVGQT